MAKNGFRAFDSDMHVFEPADLYTKYMNPKVARAGSARQAANQTWHDTLLPRRRQTDPAAQ